MLVIEGLRKNFGAVPIIRDLSLRVERGERVVILGPNGAGKTTLLRLIAGEIAPDQGRITCTGRDITRLPVHARARMGLGRSFQTPALFEGFTIAANLAMAAGRPRNHRNDRPRPSDGPRPNDHALPPRDPGWLADHFGLHPLDRPVAGLDHGTRRELDLAMALAGGPRLILLDEPASGLGAAGGLYDQIAGLPRDLTMIVIEHDLDLAFALADRVVILKAGQIAFDGAPAAARPVLDAIYDA